MFNNLSISEISSLIQKKDVKPSEVCSNFISWAKEDISSVKTFNYIDEEATLNKAKELDSQPEPSSAVFGIPIAVKDNICTVDMPTTCSSFMLKNYVSPFDATAILNLRNAGAVIMGKTNIDEFGLDHKFDGTAKAVSSGLAPAGISSDTGGTLLFPAANCGVIGYRPSYGLVSRHGLIANAGSFDQIGVVAKSVADVTILASVICSFDTNDSTSQPNITPDFSVDNKFNLKGKKIGVISHSENDAQKVFKSLGAEVAHISLPSIEYSHMAFYTIMLAEVSSNLSKFDGIRFGHRSVKSSDIDSLYVNSRTEGFGLLAKKHIIAGNYILSSGNYDQYYRKARILQSMIAKELAEVFKNCDVILAPTLPNELCLDYAALASLGKLPAVAMSGQKLLIGKRFDDATLLKFAHVIEMSR